MGSPAIAAALCLGFIAQLLLFDEWLGLNIFAVAAGTLVAGALAARARLHPADRWLPPTTLLFATFPALRSEPALLAFDIPATLALLLASAVARSPGRP